MTNIVYANRRVPGAVIAVPTAAFVQSQRVSKAAVQVAQETMISAPVAVVPSVAPTHKSVRGAAAKSGNPPARVFERPVVARTEPPAAHAGFAAQQPQLAAKPGHPLDEAVRKQLKPVAAVPVPVVNVVAPPSAAPRAMTAPPAAPAAAQAPEQRGKHEPRGKPQDHGSRRGQKTAASRRSRSLGSTSTLRLCEFGLCGGAWTPRVKQEMLGLPKQVPKAGSNPRTPRANGSSRNGGWHSALEPDGASRSGFGRLAPASALRIVA